MQAGNELVVFSIFPKNRLLLSLLAPCVGYYRNGWHHCAPAGVCWAERLARKPAEGYKETLINSNRLWPRPEKMGLL